MINIKLRIGAKSINTGHNPVRIAAKTPITSVPRWFPKYPIILFKKILEYNS